MDMCGNCTHYKSKDDRKGTCTAQRSGFYVTPKSCLGCMSFKEVPMEIKQQRILHSPFDPKVHKENFVNYLEVVITPDGVVHYAVPSHTMFIEWYAKNVLHIELTGQPYDWARKVQCIMVWNEHFIGEPNDEQLKALKMLSDEGLYTGSLEKGGW